MKNKIRFKHSSIALTAFVLSFVLFSCKDNLFFANSLFAQNSKSAGYSSGNNPHDSLLFDGEGKHRTMFGCVWSDNCVIKVWEVKGIVIGTVIYDTLVVGGCELWDTAQVCRRRQLKPGDYLMPGDSLVTGPDSYVEIRRRTKSMLSLQNTGVKGEERIIIGDNSSGTMDCIIGWRRGKIWLEQQTGSLKEETGKAIDNAVESLKSKFRPKGTQYSIEVTESQDILKVYDGSVEVVIKKYDDSGVKNTGQELQKLNEDYQAGKISMEEYIQKAKEYQEIMKKEVGTGIRMKETVSAGFQIIVAEKLGDVTPIGPDNDRWWEK